MQRVMAAFNPYARRTDGTYAEPLLGRDWAWYGTAWNRTEAEGHAATFDVPICHNDHGQDEHFRDCADTAKPCPVATYLRENQP